jgi:ATP-binding protein involved in chromosome partitioning
LAALSTIQDPDLGRDIVSLGFVKEVAIKGGEVDVTIELTTPACPVRDLMKSQAEDKVKALSGVDTVRVQMTASVRMHAGPSAIPGVRNIVAVGAGKGGVGKSTTAVNLAVALSLEGARVGLLDGDLYGPNIPQMLGLTSPPEVDEAQRITPPLAHGIRVISVGMFVPKDEAVIWRGPMLHKAIQQFMREVNWGELDYLVVDLPPGTGDVSISVAQTVPVAGAIVVTTPQDISVSDVRKAVMMFRQLNIPVLGVVENMSHFVCGHCGERAEIFGSGGGRRMAEESRIPFLGEVPIEALVRSGGDEGRPVVVAAPESAAARALREVARQAAAQLSIQALAASPDERA